MKEDNTPNKAGEAYIKLYHDEWRSSQSVLPTDPSKAEFRGFRGEYEVKIIRGDQELSEIRFKLEDDISFECISDLLGGLFCDS